MNVFPQAEIFIDSSVIINECYDFHGGDLARLKHYCELGIVRLLTSELVVKEVENNIKQEVQLYSSKLRNFIHGRKPINELKLLDEKHQFLFEDFRKLGWDDYIVSQWHDYIQSTECFIVPFSSVEISDIITDYFCQNPPFENSKLKKSEFPDSIIIKSILNYAKDALTPICIFTYDRGWASAFPDERVTPDKDSPCKFLVVDNINSILKHLYKIELNETELAKNILNDIDRISQEISSRVISDLEEMSMLVEGDNKDLVVLIEDYDEIESLTISSIDVSFSSFEKLSDEFISLIFDVDCEVKITFTIIDYDNSIYDSEDKVYLFIKQPRITQTHYCLTSIQSELAKSENDTFHITSIKYPYQIVLSDDSLIYSDYAEDDDVFDDDSQIIELYEPDDDSMDTNLYEPDDDSIGIIPFTKDDIKSLIQEN